MNVTINLAGGLIAGYCSWSMWHSLAWAIVNGFLSWFYVVYWLIYYGDW